MPTTLNNSKVSVIVPFYNRGKFLAETIESILGQTYSNWELILVDDGSTDRSELTARHFISKHPEKIFIYSHPKNENLGASSSRNLGVQNATGDFITFVDSDDILLQDALEIQLNAFHENPDADVVCGTLRYWFSWDKLNYQKESDFVVDLGVDKQKLYRPPQLFIHNLGYSGRKPGMGCFMVRKGITDGTRLFEDGFRYTCEDQICWAKLSLNTKIYVLDRCLLKYRQHSISSTSEVTRERRAISDWEQFLEWLDDYLKESAIDDSAVWSGLESTRREVARRRTLAPILDIYRKLLPIRVRYRIRDWISRNR